VPLFTNDKIDREAIFWEHEGNRAVRAGEWKLVAKHNRPWELYKVSQDRVEAHDLANQEPSKRDELIALYEGYAKRCLVAPWPLKKGK